MPTKGGYYWFRGEINDLTWTGEALQVSSPVFVFDDLDEVQVLSWAGGSFDLQDFDGEWQELTEETIFG